MKFDGSRSNAELSSFGNLNKYSETEQGGKLSTLF